MTSSLRVGLVGVGGIARDQHLPGWAQVPFAKVVALADVSAEALARVVPDEEIMRTTDWRRLVERDDIDIIDICTPNRTHSEIALAALGSGKHVLCEKPLATTSAEVEAMTAAARLAGRLIMTAQHLRFAASAVVLKAELDRGLAGRVYYARAQWLRRRLLPSRPTFTERRFSGGGPCFDIGVHVLDLALWFMAAGRPERVSALLGCALAHRADLTGDWGEWDRQRFDVEDFAVGLVHFRGGACLVLETSWLLFQPEREIIRLQGYGDRAGFVWPDGLLVGETDREPWDVQLPEPEKNKPHHDLIRAFAEAVRDGKPAPIPVEDTLDVIRILEAFEESSRGRREVMLP